MVQLTRSLVVACVLAFALGLYKASSYFKSESLKPKRMVSLLSRKLEDRLRNRDRKTRGGIVQASVDISLQRTQLASTTSTTLESTSKPISPTTKPYYYGEKNCTPNRYRPTLLELFKEWTKIAKKHSIEYILCGGSLLGQMRDGDVIPYDSDIDIQIEVKYLKKIKEIAGPRGFDEFDGKIRLIVQPELEIHPSTERKRYDCQGKKVPHMTDECAFQEPVARLMKTGLHIDMYDFHDHGQTVEDFLDEVKQVYNRRDFYPIQPCTFLGLNALCPNNPFRVLEIYFKNNRFMEPSKKCKRGEWV